MKIWEMKKTVYKVSDFISWQKNNTLELSPSFQRRPVWSARGKSYLMDTIFRGLPVPVIFLREKTPDLKKLESKREVVDGQQRLRTIFSYLDSTLLKDYNEERDSFSILKSHNPELAGKKFSDLPADLKQKILDYEFSTHILPAQVDDREILQIFARMNSTGVKLNEQELRNAEFIGEFKTSMYELASEQLERWREWNIFTEIKIARMEEAEITSEFAFLMLKGLTGKSQEALNKIYKEKEDEFAERIEVERRFRFIMNIMDEKLDNDIRVLFNQKSAFYSLFVVFYDVIFGLGSLLKKNSPQKSIKDTQINGIKNAGLKIKNQKAPENVLNALTRRTTNLDSRKTVLKYFKEKAKA